MGWASIIEDALERIEDGYSNRDGSPDHRAPVSAAELARQRAALTRVVKFCTDILQDFNRALELATDLSIDLAGKVRALEEERDLGVVREIRELRNENFELKNKLGRCKADKMEIQKLCEKLKKDLARLKRGHR